MSRHQKRKKRGKALGGFRKHQGNKQLEVSLLSGISQSRLSLIENGWVEPRPDELERIEAALAKLAEGKWS